MFSCVFLLVVGVGEEDRVGGLVFVALMFIGAGVGMLFGRPDAGGAIGMGLGFLAMAYLKMRGVVAEAGAGEPVRVSPVAGAAALALVGGLFVVAGVALLLGLSLPWHIVGGLVAIALGVFFLVLAFRVVKV